MHFASDTAKFDARIVALRAAYRDACTVLTQEEVEEEEWARRHGFQIRKEEVLEILNPIFNDNIGSLGTWNPDIY